VSPLDQFGSMLAERLDLYSITSSFLLEEIVPPFHILPTSANVY
jgi:hypothetical protein